MVVVRNLLVIHGGLLSQQQGQAGLEGVCPSNDITLIDLVASCNGRPAITLFGVYNVLKRYAATYMYTNSIVAYTVCHTYSCRLIR